MRILICLVAVCLAPGAGASELPIQEQLIAYQLANGPVMVATPSESVSDLEAKLARTGTVGFIVNVAGDLQRAEVTTSSSAADCGLFVRRQGALWSLQTVGQCADPTSPLSSKRLSEYYGRYRLQYRSAAVYRAGEQLTVTRLSKLLGTSSARTKTSTKRTLKTIGGVVLVVTGATLLYVAAATAVAALFIGMFAVILGGGMDIVAGTLGIAAAMGGVGALLTFAGGGTVALSLGGKKYDLGSAWTGAELQRELARYNQSLKVQLGLAAPVVESEPEPEPDRGPTGQQALVEAVEIYIEGARRGDSNSAHMAQRLELEQPAVWFAKHFDEGELSARLEQYRAFHAALSSHTFDDIEDMFNVVPVEATDVPGTDAQLWELRLEHGSHSAVWAYAASEDGKWRVVGDLAPLPVEATPVPPQAD